MMINIKTKADFVSFRAVQVAAVALINLKIFKDLYLSYNNNTILKILNTNINY
jgi:hypothetical protein